MDPREPISLTAQVVAYCDCVDSVEPSVVVIPALDRPGTCAVCGARWIVSEIAHKVLAVSDKGMQVDSTYSVGKIGPPVQRVQIVQPGVRP